MIEIIKNLFIGSDIDCQINRSNMKTIHACKTCHQSGVGYHGNLSSSHPNYLIYEKNNNVYLNMIDMERELLARYTHPIMKVAMDFIKKYIDTLKVLIHCNQGQSRAPSIGLLYLARTGIINNDSYHEATTDFIKKYPGYSPGRGIALYLKNNWKELLAL